MDQHPSLQQPRVTAESQLLQAVERLARHRDGRLGLHIHLSRLQAEHRRDHHIRVAARTLESGMRSAEGQIFVLHNRDIFFIGKNVPDDVATNAIIRLRYLFSEDPVIQFSDNSDAGDFCSWYRFETDYDLLLDEVRKLNKVVSVIQNEPGAHLRQPRQPLNALNLAKLQQTLAQANVSALVRNQSICSVPPNSQPVPIFDEVFISVEHIQKNLLPDVDLRASRWLFLDLTETLDKRVLAYMRKETIHIDKPFSLNLNLATILTPEFMQFDEDLSSRLRGRLVIELHATDIFADVGSFFFVRDFLKDRGHRICLDGITQYTLPLLKEINWNFDLIKVFWSQRLAGTSAQSRKDQDMFGEALKRQGDARTILARCDHPDAIMFGRERGIDLFQGFSIDAMIREGQNNVRKAGFG